MHAVEFVTGEPIKQSIRDHAARAAQTFFGGLKDQDHRPVKIARVHKVFGRAQQHRRMPIVTAGMHDARIF